MTLPLGPSDRESFAIDDDELGLFIDGEFRDSSDGNSLIVSNPATGTVLTHTPAASPSDVADAVDAAARASAPWARLSGRDRGILLRRLTSLIDSNRLRLAALETLDTGKPHRDVTEVDLPDTIQWFDYFATLSDKVRSDVIPVPPGYFNFTRREPYGVAGLITAWNYPLPLCAIKMPAALAAGNTVVLKPAEQTPLTALALARLARDAGLPPGVVNVVPGYGEVAGRALVGDSRVGVISFTGSTDVGREIMARASQNMTPVILELGGKSPNIVFADADLAAAAAASVFTFCVNQGQLCTAGSRLLVDDRIRDNFISRVVEGARELTVGDPWDPATQLGALVSTEQLDRVERYVAIGTREGAKLLEGGERARVEQLPGGFFFRPTVFDEVEPAMTIAREEIFGPVLSIIPFSTETEAITLANHSRYGLAAAIWTRDLQRAHRLADSLQAGLVYVNTLNVTDPASPYGGYRQSGIGVEGGTEQLGSFMRLKSVWMNVGADAPRL